MHHGDHSYLFLCFYTSLCLSIFFVPWHLDKCEMVVRSLFQPAFEFKGDTLRILVAIALSISPSSAMARTKKAVLLKRAARAARK